MEHSLLHALQLCGIVVALGGAFFALAIFRPACWSPSFSLSGSPLQRDLHQSLIRWTWRAAAFGALAAFLNLFVDVAEVNNQTIFGGVRLSEVWRFATVTTVGQLAVARIAALLGAALAVRYGGRVRWPLALLLTLAAALFNSLVCHAAAQPTGRASAITLQFVHILAAGIWLGSLIQLLFARRNLEAASDPDSYQLLRTLVARFSPIALGAVILILLSGVVAAIRYLVTPAAIPTSAYGLTLVIKLVLLLPLLYAGWLNSRLKFPPSDPKSALATFGRRLELEVTAGVLVIVVAGILASVSPPGDSPALRLTAAQQTALLSPHLPVTAIVDPQKFVGAAERTVDDLRYGEFMHNWSGVFVILLGLCWLGQSLRGRASPWAEKLWPLLMIPFAGFIAYAADPEVWVLRTMSFAQVLADPGILEHQLGALLVLILVWLGWRDRRRPLESRPLGYALPALMIVGSLLLIGHAHSALNATQELTNLINVQHAVFGMFGLFAGATRWLELRQLLPARIARVAWPACVIALGVVLAFFYREAV